MDKVLFSSATDMWSTPQYIFDKYNEIYHFTCDVCAVKSNAKCDFYFSPEDDGLKQIWKGSCWCNPPYGRSIGKWVEKAFYSDCTVVMLLPARTDTKWFHNYIYNKAKIVFIKGRLKFGDSTNSAPFPSMIVIFERGCKNGKRL